MRDLDQARDYILKGPVDSYDKNGFGLYLTLLKAGATPIGLCGLVKRDTLEHPDVGYAFLPEFWSRGYAFEAAAAVLDYARDVLGLRQILAVVSPDNDSSIRLLKRLGLKFAKLVRLKDDTADVSLFALL